MELLITVPTLDESDGGPARTVRDTVLFALRNRWKVHLLFRRTLNPVEINIDDQNLSVYVTGIGSKNFKFLDFLAFSCCAARLMWRNKNISGVHDNGIWTLENLVIVSLSKFFSLPTMITVHGMLEPWAFKNGSRFKRVYFHFIQKPLLNSVKLIHVTGTCERLSLEYKGFSKTVRSVPNAISPPNVSRRPALRFCRSFVYVGRIHPKKGLLMLISAWASVQTTDATLHIFGPVEDDDYLNKVLSRISKLGLENSVCYAGVVRENDKWNILRSADCLILPSFSENFGLVVPEALSMGLPVITTTGTPWRDLVTEGCGYYVEPKKEDIEVAVRAALTLSPGEYKRMSESAIQYSNRFHWAEIESKMNALYLELTSQ